MAHIEGAVIDMGNLGRQAKPPRAEAASIMNHEPISGGMDGIGCNIGGKYPYIDKILKLGKDESRCLLLLTFS